MVATDTPTARRGLLPARLTAGGQSLVAMLNFRLARPSVLVDLSRVPGLRTISVDNDNVVVGALVTQAEVERSRVVADRCSLIPKALRYVGHVQIRSRGTISRPGQGYTGSRRRAPTRRSQGRALFGQRH